MVLAPAAALAALLKVAPVSLVLFGTDFPFRPGSEEVEGLVAYVLPRPTSLRSSAARRCA